jgi:tetratricopeptide (TPR) repeat protein
MKLSRIHVLFAMTMIVAATTAGAQAPAARPGGADADYGVTSKADLNLPPSFPADILRMKEGRPVPMRGVYIFKFDASGALVVADNPQGARFESLPMTAIKQMTFELPEDMTEALAAYRDGDYSRALPLLEKAVARYQALRELDGSMVPKAEILLLDCQRRTKAFPKLRDMLAVVKPERYDAWGKEYLRVFPAWDAYAAKDWKRIELISRDLDTLSPGTPAAELAFLRAEALNKLDQKDEALVEYHRAMAMDFTRSRDLMGDAAIAALEIYNTKAEVKDYFERAGTPDYNPDAAYVIPAKEAAFLANMLRTLKPGGRILPTSLGRFIQAYDNFAKEKKPDAAADDAPAPATPGK